MKSTYKVNEEVVKKIAERVYDNGSTVINRNDLEEMFPELAESDDERIRKALLEMVHDTTGDELWVDYGVHKEDALAWLEKQGEHVNFRNKIQIGDKVTRNRDGYLVNLSQLNRVAKVDEKQGEQKPTDKVEPKFKDGVWVVYDGWTCQITDVKEDGYCNDHNGFIPKDREDDMRLWTIQDAKVGDVLYLQHDGKEHIIIYKGVIRERFRTFVSAYCAYNGVVDAFCFADVSRYHDIAYGGIVPATKEQRDTLMKAMADAGYTFDFEKKELKKIEKKSAWSEEDKIIIGVLNELVDATPYKDFHNATKYDCINFLRTIEKRVFPQPQQELNEEDLCKIEHALIDTYAMDSATKILNKIKSLRPQNTWKPSDEQMEYLLTIKTLSPSPLLESLYVDLKKLREE